MASSPEDTSSPPGEPQQDEEAAADEQQQNQRQQRSQEMRLQQKKNRGGVKSDKRRQADVEDVDGSAGADSGEDSQGDEVSTALPQAPTSARKATGVGAAGQRDASSADENEEGQPPSKEAPPDDPWEHDRQPPITGPVNVVYCGVCGMPPDYCEFGSQWKRCKAWLEQHHPELLPYALPPEELAAAKEEAAEKCGGSRSNSAADSAAPDGTSSHVNSNTSGTATAGDLAQQLAENLRLSVAATQEAAAALGLDAAEDIPTDAQAAGVKKKATKGKSAAQPAIVSIQRQSRAKRKTMTVVVGLDFFGVKLANATKIFSKRFACGASVSKNPLGHPPQQVEVQGDVEEAIVEVIESVFNVPSDKIVVLPRK